MHYLDKQISQSSPGNQYGDQSQNHQAKTKRPISELKHELMLAKMPSLNDDRDHVNLNIKK